MSPPATPIYPRFSIRALNAALSDTPVVLVVGPRQAGKSTLVRQFSLTGARPYLTLDDQSLLMSAKNDPQGEGRHDRDRAGLPGTQKAGRTFGEEDEPGPRSP